VAILDVTFSASGKAKGVGATRATPTLRANIIMRLNILAVIALILFSSLGCQSPLAFDSHGVAHGTGEKVYNYKSGVPMLREEYRDGKPVRSRWFGPNGTFIQETKWVDGTGEGIYLREDGSIRTRMPYVKGIAEGIATDYDEAGNFTTMVQYRGGQPVSAGDPPATRSALHPDEVRVTDALSGRPIRDAKVTPIFPSFNGRTYTTNADGVAPLPGIPRGGYGVDVDAPGYERRTFSTSKWSGESLDVALKPASRP
jgi:hypothetical protein